MQSQKPLLAERTVIVGDDLQCSRIRWTYECHSATAKTDDGIRCSQFRVDLPDEPGFEPYGQLVPMTRPVFSPDGNTAYMVTDVAGDGLNPYSFLYAIDVAPSSGGNTPPAVSLVATSPTTINRGGSVSFRGSFTDPDVGDGPWSYLWSFGLSGTVTTPGNIVATRTFRKRGIFSVVLNVTDARGAAGASNAIKVRVR